MPLTLPSVATKAVIEPLCRATETLLTPAGVFTNDYLELDIDKDVKRFKVEPVTMRPYTGALAWNESPEQVITWKGKQYVRGTHPSHNARERWIVKVPERRDMGFGRWIMAGTDFTVLVIAHNWPADRIVFKSEAAELLYNYLLHRFVSQSHRALIAAKYKVSDELPQMPPDFISHATWPLMPYQQVALAMTLGQEAAALFMEQGTGKTPVVINRICLEGARKRAGRIPGLPKTLYRALIVCPNQVRMNWQQEFIKFATTPGKCSVLRGDYEPRVRKLVDGTRDEADCAWSATMVGYDTIEPTLDALEMVAWDLVVLDESHLVKNPRTARWAAAMALRNKHVRQRMLLTGTPIANTVMDLWAQLEFLGDGLSGFLSFANYRKFHGIYQKREALTHGTSVEKLVGLKNTPLIQERLARISFMIRKSEANLQLPEKLYDVVEVQMTSQQAEWYNTVKEQLSLELAGIMSDESKRLTTDHVLTKLLRLAQITCGFVKWDAQYDTNGNVTSPGREEPIPGGNPKIDAVIERIKDEIEADPNGKKIIWCVFRQDIFAFQRRLEAEGIKHLSYYGDVPDPQRDGLVKQFNSDPDVKVFLANPKTAGAGLNLLGYTPERPEACSTYCDHEIFFSQGWAPVERSQAEDRAHRKGMRAPALQITDVVVPGTVDEEIRARVLQKQKTAFQIQDIRDILKAVLDWNR